MPSPPNLSKARLNEFILNDIVNIESNSKLISRNATNLLDYTLLKSDIHYFETVCWYAD